VKVRVDVILAGGDAAVRAAQQATTSVPILALTDDMLAKVERPLGQPGGNTTGVTLLVSELDGKRQELLIEAVPGVRRVAALADSNTTTSSRLRERRHTHAALHFRSIRSGDARKSGAPSMRQRRLALERLTSWHHRFSSTVVPSF